MKKKLLMMTGAFIIGGAAAIGLRHYLVKQEKEHLTSYDEDNDEEDDIDDFGFKEDLDLDFEIEKSAEERAKEYEELVEDLIKSVTENRLLFNDDQAKKLQSALNRRADELRLINSLYGEVGANE